MIKDAFLKTLPFILSVMLCMTSLIVTVRAESWSWSKIASPAGEYLSVDMVNSNDGWAVGFDGAIIHWDGKSWNNVPSPTSYKLVSVDMVSSTEGWAIAQRIDGYQTNQSIIRWDGTSWNNVTSPTAAMLTSVDMVSSTDGWAVGSDGCIIHWDGTSWSNVTSPTGAWLYCVNMVSSTDGWIVGADGIYRWQEEVTGFPADYLIVVFAVVVANIKVVLLLIRNRRASNTH